MPDLSMLSGNPQNMMSKLFEQLGSADPTMAMMLQMMQSQQQTTTETADDPMLSKALDQAEMRDASLIALDDAITSLATFDPQQSQIVELRYFGGLTIAETAEVLGVSDSTVEREWALARAWVRRELSRQ